MRFVSCGAVAVVIAIASPAAAQLQSLSGQLSASAGVTDNANLEDLARTAARLGRWEFLLTVAPLRLANVTGSPVNPIAVF